MERNQGIPNAVEQLQTLAGDLELPGRRLRLAVLLRAFHDVREGGRWGWDARRWLLGEEGDSAGLDARSLMEEAGLDVEQVRRTLRGRPRRERNAA